LFPAGITVETLLQKFPPGGAQAQIVGPHGSGKSTLLVCLAEALARSERIACRFDLHDGQRSMSEGWVEQARRTAADTILVDGYEQLSWWSRWRLSRECRRNAWSLLVTAHADVGLPTLLRVTPTLDDAQAVVARLLTGTAPLVTPDDVAECFAATGNNLRETLFALYDRHERRARGADRGALSSPPQG
jgi:energy-coupling factor transporter ATP-binding protein EcfA2